MINIFSHDSPELTTELVMDWIAYLGYTSRRINGKDLMTKEPMTIHINNIDGVAPVSMNYENSISWFRKWINSDDIENSILECEEYSTKDVSKLIKSEFRGISEFFFHSLRHINWYNLPPYLKEYPNKIQQLDIAQSIGLSIPDSIVTNSKKELITFYEKIGRSNIIIKPIKEIGLIGNNKGEFFVPYTCEISSHLNKVPNFFFPSLFQKSINKDFEARIFYFDGKCYPMAIFSNTDNQTKGDFRRYNWNRPNRNVPLKLELAFENKIIDLMNTLELNTGSLDFLYNKNEGYVFLEVNPTGQFGMVSFPCNYFLEKLVAETLVSKISTPH